MKESEQEESGFGCYFNRTTIIHFIEIGSPCESAGLKRGDELIKINNKEATSESFWKAKTNDGVESIFTVIRDNKNIDIKITPSVYNYKVSKNYVFTSSSGKKVGYLIYNGFSALSSVEIDEAFTNFKNQNIDELILDLRYNGGGLVYMAQYLLDKIASFNFEGDVQYTINSKDIKNGKLVSTKEESVFKKHGNNNIDISRVFFLTSENTASASELVINSLKPYLDVKLIGSRTHGKPVGMTGRYISSNYLYWLIDLSMKNADGNGDYFSGLSVDCDVTDTVSLQRDDPKEDLLHEALYYIENEWCSNGRKLSDDFYTFVNFLDIDGDGILNSEDDDDDNDGVLDVNDSFPEDPSESIDTDNDGIGNNTDTDDDNDGVLDSEDFYPLDSNCSKQNQGDGSF
ncbi:MAG: hypothetical protein GY932_06280, partial [Arcobacter sp.]|nr:hypothetical protein [Arcobacter sp.]